MSKYFILYETDSTLEYPEDIDFIKKVIESKYGKFNCSDIIIDKLWRDFSEEEYDAGFLDPDGMFIEDFVKWLKEQE